MNCKTNRSITILFTVLLPCLIVVVLMGLAVRPSQAQIVIYVDDDSCPATGAGTQASPYCHIQDAVDAANDNYEIRVAAGNYTGVRTVPVEQWAGEYTYTQVVIITKSLTLQGGYSPNDWYTPDPAVNLTVIDAERQGRGVSIVGTIHDHPFVTVDGFTITGGDYTDLGNPDKVSNWECNNDGADCGGGFYAYRSGFTLRNCIINDNIASRNEGAGGGIYFAYTSAPSAIEDTRIISNSAPGTYGTGGGLYGIRVNHPLTIAQSIFEDNVAQQVGGGAVLAFNIEDLVTIIDTDFLSNTAVSDLAGGLYVRLSENGEILRMDRARFQNNQALNRAGALYLDVAGAVTPNARLTNLLFTGNSLNEANSDDAIVHIDGTFTSLDVEMAHITAVDNSAVTFLYAKPGNDPGDTMTVHVQNALLSFFTNAYAAEETVNGAVVIEHDNTLTQYVTNLHQSVGGSPTFTANNPLTGDPKLSATYHLQSGSAAIDAGVNAGVATDLDGQTRPNGTSPDIGADEFLLYNLYLPAILR